MYQLSTSIIALFSIKVFYVKVSRMDLIKQMVQKLKNIKLFVCNFKMHCYKNY